MKENDRCRMAAAAAAMRRCRWSAVKSLYIQNKSSFSSTKKAGNVAVFAYDIVG